MSSASSQILPAFTGAVSLPVPRAAITKVAVAGIDLVITTADGQAWVLQGAALRVAAEPGFRIQLADGALDGQALLAEAGKVDISEAVSRSVQKDAPPDVDRRERPPEVAADEAPSRPPAASGMVATSLGAELTGEASMAAPERPVTIVTVGQGEFRQPPSPSAGTPSPPIAPPPPPEPERLSVRASMVNVVDQQKSDNPAGGQNIVGGGGTAQSANDRSSIMQVRSELIEGTTGDDQIRGDGAGGMGNGWARWIEIDISGRGEVLVMGVTLSGLPGNYEIVGAKRVGTGWQLDLPDDPAAATSVRAMVRYAVAADGSNAPREFMLGVKVKGVLNGEPLETQLQVPVMVRDVRSAADLEYTDAQGRAGLVLPAFGLGDDIRAGAGNDTIEGLVGHDRIDGGAGNDLLDGGQGDDTLIGGAGADRLIGGTGRDTASYEGSGAGVTVDLVDGSASGGDAAGDTFDSIENLTGSDHADVLRGTASSNRIDGGAGDDLLEGRGGADDLLGGSGRDTATYANSGAAVRVNLADGVGQGGEAEGDRLESIENLIGSAHADLLVGSVGNNTLDGGAGDDTLDGGAGADQLIGGAGVDTVDYTASRQGVQVSLGTGQGLFGDAQGDRLQDVENLRGSDHDDELTGNGGVNRLEGGSGDDTLEGAGGADELRGGDGRDTASYVGAETGVRASLVQADGNTGDAAGDTYDSIENLEGSEFDDVLEGNAGDNLIVGNPGDDVLQGGAGDDTLDGGAGADVLDGGDGFDIVSYAAASQAVRVDLSNTVASQGGDATGDRFVRVEALQGTRFADRLGGDAADNVLDGGKGADTLAGGAGADTLIGGDGSDTADYSSSTVGVQIDLAANTASGGDATGDKFESIENVSGGSADDRLSGDASNNRLSGNGGNDLLIGGAGSDTLDGGDGDDRLEGGSGADVLIGGAGADTADYRRSSAGVTVDLQTGIGLGGDAEGDRLAGLEHVEGSELGDRLLGDAQDNRLSGFDGDDVLEGRGGADVLVGGAGIDTASYASAVAGVALSLAAGTGTMGEAAGDQLDGIENLTGSAWDDQLTGDLNANELAGGAGDDTLVGGGGADRLLGGAGGDTADYAASDAGVQVSLRSGQGLGGDAEGDLLDSIENLVGSGQGDTLEGSDGDNRLDGGAGNDLLRGGRGADELIGGAGIDTASYAGADGGVVASLAQPGLNAGDAAGDSYDSIENLIGTGFDDALTGDANGNRLEGGDGNDTLTGGEGADTLVGGSGIDTASYAGAVTGVAASLAQHDTNGGEAAGDIYESIENLTGSAFADVLTGHSGANRLEGGIGADTLSGGAGADTLVGGEGIDTATYATSAAAVSVSLTTGRGTGGDAQGDALSGIENLIGSAHDDLLTGSAAANRIEGGDGNDQIDGGAGADTLIGGAGDDRYVVDSASDVVIEAAGEGFDTVRASVSHALGANLENLVLTGVSDTDGTGNNLDNEITGNAGSNRIDGGLGADTMSGGSGDDTYLVDQAGDLVAEEPGAGDDTVLAAISYRLTDQVENLVLTGTALTGTGNDLDNRITGNDANNVLDGSAGADTMAGGAGDDIYLLDDAGDVVVELQGNGNDLVRSRAGTTLSANVERLELTGTANVNGTGNSLANTLTGNSGANVLDGAAGADTMLGGGGDDTYVVDDADDVVVENPGEGADLVRASISYQLGAEIENLQLVGEADLQGTGNGLDNRLTGNDGANRLDGGVGADTMAGGLGNDTYLVDNAGDVIVEAAGEGRDSVQSRASHVLADNVEDLVLLGTGSLSGTGNSLDNEIAGNEGNNILDGGGGTDTLTGGLGDDTYVVDRASDVIVEAAGEGIDTVRSSVSWTLGATLEHLVLTGNANISGTGNAFNNLITGNNGNNVLDGGAGADTMAGGAGDDTYLVDNAGDEVVEQSGQGIDTVRAAFSMTLAANVENLVLLGSGNLSGTGNAGANRIEGNSGNNTLDGGSGADTLIGGSGDDTYIVSDTLAEIVEFSGGGNDRVQSSVSYTLSAEIEQLTLTGSDNIDGTGNELDNQITGNNGANVLDGGAGADTLRGGDGDDVYVIDSEDDVIEELEGRGRDTVRASFTYTLEGKGSLENLELTGDASINGTGSALNNHLRGNAGDNVLDGAEGADTMAGGGGNDTYLVDNTNDVVVEASGAGIDTVNAVVSFTLSNHVENLRLIGPDAIAGTGNGGANMLTGNDENNLLDGRGGADTMEGGAGDDTYGVDDSGDVINELPGEGNDTVRSTISYVLGEQLENLVLIGTDSVNATGNAGANLIVGNGANNVIDGGGGADTLDGGQGNDTFVLRDADFVSLAGGTGYDTLAIDGSSINTLQTLVGKVTGIEGVDLRGGSINSFTVTGAQLATTGLLGSDANNRLEVRGDQAEGDLRDVLFLRSGDFTGVLNPGSATGVKLSDGTDGRLFASSTPGGAGIVVDNTTIVLPDTVDLAMNWGVNFTTPGMLPGNGLFTWLDASDMDGDGVSEGAGEAVLGAGGTVTQWVDRTGLNTMSSANVNFGASGQPTWVATGAGGLPTVRFDGNDYMGSSLSFGNTYTVFAVGQMAGTQNGRLVSSSTRTWIMGWHNGAQDRFHPEGWVTPAAPAVVANQLKLYTATGAGTGSALYSDGSLVASATWSSGSLGNLALGGGGSGGELSRGDVSEVIVYNRALSEVERQQVEQYLRTKWLGAPVAPDTGLGILAFDPTWAQAPVRFGDQSGPAADALAADYGTAPERGAGRIDTVLLGGQGNDTLTGGSRNDALFGGAGNDRLIGGAGRNYLAGGTGDDTYVVSSGTDYVFEAAGAGTDIVESSVSFVLMPNIERLVLTGTASINGTGNDLDNVITGNAGNNTLMGGRGNDTLTGNAGNDWLDGGVGADSMTGGAGDDTYVIDNPGDVVVELAGGGTDTVRVNSSFDLGLNAEIENIVITSTTAVTATGSAGNNAITVARFAPGVNHTLVGGAGNDTYTLQTDSVTGHTNIDHVLVEEAGGGNDTLVLHGDTGTARTFVLPANFENLNLYETWNLSGTGDAGANRLVGTSRWWAYNSNWTTLTGGAGNDTYQLNSPNTRIVELADGGTDTVEINVNMDGYVLPAHLENLTIVSGGNQKGVGNAVANVLTGNAWNNWLDGRAGNDTMAGGAGNDTYVVDSVGDVVTEAANAGFDTIRTALADFSLATRANVEGLTFTGTGPNNGVGNDLNNRLEGNVGNDTLSGGAGADTLVGGGGADSLVGGDGNDVLMSEAVSTATGITAGLRAQFFTHASLPLLESIETTLNRNWGTGSPGTGVPADNWTMRLTGQIEIAASGWYRFKLDNNDDAHLWLDGVLVARSRWSSTTDPIWLEAGSVPLRVDFREEGGDASMRVQWQPPSASGFSDIPGSLLSHGSAVVAADIGVDTMVGGAGNDTYVVRNANHVIVEVAGGGIDTVESELSYSIAGTELENVRLTGNLAINATGNDAANQLTGNSAANVLEGGAGNDTLLGMGGADRLEGGAGNDLLQAAGGSTLNGGDGDDVLTILDPWTPAQLPGLALWLDAADLDGDGVQEGAAESGLNGSAVATWADKSGLGRHAVQNTVAWQPTYVQGGLNGLPTIRYDGANDALRVANIPTMTGNTNSLFWVQRTTDSNYMPIMANSTANANNGGWLLMANPGDGRTDLTGSGNAHSAASYWANGVQPGWTNAGTAWNTLNGNTSVVGVVNQPFNWNGSLQTSGYGGSWTFAGDIPEIVVTSSTLSAADRQLLEGYLAWKWGGQELLAADHPYRTASPSFAGTGAGGQLNGGAGADTLTGGLNADTLDGGEGADSMTGGAGDDVYVVDNAADVVVELEGGGIDTVRSNLSLTLGAFLERLELQGSADLTGDGNALDNALIGNAGANRLSGGAGNDTLDGGLGADTLEGGTGNDTYVVDDGGDTVVEAADAGTDLVLASVSHALAAHIENLTLTGTAANGIGNELNNLIVGNDSANQLVGAAGADTLQGGAGVDTLLGGDGDDVLDGGVGSDRLEGGAGNDTYIVDQPGDAVVEAADGGIDTVQSSGSYTLGAHVENLVLTGSLAVDGFGNDLNNVMTGNAVANRLEGGAGADTLEGGGGADTLDGGTGADSMTGGTGDDTYVVDDVGDVVAEAADGGIDTVVASVSLTLSDAVENLVLTGEAAIDGTGNGLDNALTGNAGANRLAGGAGRDTLLGGAGDDTLDGGQGIDTMEGGTGDDTYEVDNASDAVVEAEGAGTDTVRASVSHALTAHVERLVLTGNTAIDGTGNTLANEITGNSAANRLDGGAGADTMTGGAGDDTYLVDDAGDVVVEDADGGTDTVLASVTHALAAGVENLVLSGSAAIDGTGNALANQITGNAAANRLDGGAGADTLEGGAGDDTYVIDDAGDVVLEAADGGIDTEISFVTRSLSAEVEHLVLAGTAAIDGTGNALANRITGNEAANALAGGAGNDTLFGGDGADSLDGGAGADSMEGGAGDDTYVVDDDADVVVEVEGGGIDTVRASVSRTLGAFQERLVLLGNGNLAGTGNELDNTLTGNAGSNLLVAGAGNDTLDGGTGADTLDGGAGNDTYVVDNVGDVVIEAADGGVDLVRSSVSHTLASNVEHLTLTGSAANGTGNGLDNWITGNGAANVLTGGAGADTLTGGAGADTLLGGDGNDRLEGGTGADWMDGGAGDDTYLVDNAGDVVVEAPGGGTDTEISTVTRTLAAGVENLVLAGEAGINGTGNELNNLITGNSAANILTGGAGNDTLVGGGGADVLRGGDGDDLMIAGDLSSVGFALGGAGFDTLQLSAPGSTLDLDGLIGRASGIEALDLRNGAAGSVDFSDLGLTSITDSGSLVLRLDQGDTIAIQGGGTLVQTAANDNSITYSVYSSADLTQQQVGNLQVVWGP